MKRLLQIINPRPSQRLLDLGLLLFRLLAGFALLRVHGWEKIANYEEEVRSIPDPFGLGGEVNVAIAIFSDVFCGLLVMVGLFTRLASLSVLSTTLVGLLFVHINDPWHGRDVPMVYSIMFLVIMLLGPGKYSLDNALTNTLRHPLAIKNESYS
ncbi:MAG: DoxX family protein [Cytophagales bacterium]|nr:DoxX family protein [Cytophagales bacterium]